MNPNLENLPRSPFGELVGMETLKVSAEESITALTLEEKHCNAHGTAHGGLLFTLADRAFGLADNCNDDPYVAMEMNIRYLRPALVGQRLTATARRIHQGRQTAYYRIDIEDEKGRMIACLSGTGHAMSKKK